MTSPSIGSTSSCRQEPTCTTSTVPGARLYWPTRRSGGAHSPIVPPHKQLWQRVPAATAAVGCARCTSAGRSPCPAAVLLPCCRPPCAGCRTPCPGCGTPCRAAVLRARLHRASPEMSVLHDAPGRGVRPGAAKLGVRYPVTRPARQAERGSALVAARALPAAAAVAVLRARLPDSVRARIVG